MMNTNKVKVLRGSVEQTVTLTNHLLVVEYDIDNFWCPKDLKEDSHELDIENSIECIHG